MRHLRHMRRLLPRKACVIARSRKTSRPDFRPRSYLCICPHPDRLFAFIFDLFSNGSHAAAPPSARAGDVDPSLVGARAMGWAVARCALWPAQETALPCGIQHGAQNARRVAWSSMLHATCATAAWQNAIRSGQRRRATCRTRRVPCNMQRTTYNMQRTTYGMQHVTGTTSAQHAARQSARNIQHATRAARHRSVNSPGPSVDADANHDECLSVGMPNDGGLPTRRCLPAKALEAVMPREAIRCALRRSHAFTSARPGGDCGRVPAQMWPRSWLQPQR